MRIAVLGTGMVGNTIASKLIRRGHLVKMGSRSATNAAAAKWRVAAGTGASTGTFGDAARFGDVVINCTHGASSIDALRSAGADALRAKILLDVANPLDFSSGMPPTLGICNTDSLGERIQREFPDAKVVKTLNTMNCEVMVDPALVPGDHSVFVCGNDEDARRQTALYLSDWFGWRSKNIIDLGDITAARGTEMTLALWLRLWGAIVHGNFNLQIAAASKRD
jgi:predicted dinucleotide-binding enzyme